VRQAELGRPQARLRRGAEQPRLGPARAAGQDPREVTERVARGKRAVEVAEQLRKLLGEVVGRGGAPVALQRERGAPVGAGGTADPEVDAVAVEPGEHAEAL